MCKRKRERVCVCVSRRRGPASFGEERERDVGRLPLSVTHPRWRRRDGVLCDSLAIQSSCSFKRGAGSDTVCLFMCAAAWQGVAHDGRRKTLFATMSMAGDARCLTPATVTATYTAEGFLELSLLSLSRCSRRSPVPDPHCNALHCYRGYVSATVSRRDSERETRGERDTLELISITDVSERKRSEAV